jgi:Protein of unknown function (DUF1552)
MFIKRLSLDRRTFLRGMGVALALPFLDAMVPALTAATNTAGQRRLGFVYFPNGAVMDQWIPAQAGPGFEFSPILKCLEPYKEQTVVIGNLARAGTTIGDHAVAAAGWLTGVYAKQTEAQDVRAGVTIDQIIAKQIGQENPFPSIEVATEDFTGYVGGCTPGFSCAYMDTISWATPTTPLPMEINPRVVFERMFGRPGTAKQRRVRMRRNQSVLDSIAGDASALERDLGPGDRARLSEYLDCVREIERRIQRVETQNSAEITKIDAPMGIPEAFEDHAALMFDLLAVAYQADITRVFTFMMSREASQRTYPQIDVDQPHHTLSHHGNDPEKMRLNAKINVYHAEQFAKFVGKLRATPDGDGTLLDHSLVFYGAGMGNGNAHATDPLPLVAVGGGVGKGHRHILPAPRTPVGNLWVDIADKFGAPIPSLGESTGRLEL